jgi:hypothetical protein
MAIPGDFYSLLKEQELQPGSGTMVDGPWSMVHGPSTIDHRPLTMAQGPTSNAHAAHVVDTHGTTVIAVKYDQGVLNVGVGSQALGRRGVRR